MAREFPFDPNEQCDACGKKGAFDLYGDYLCDACIRLGTTMYPDDYSATYSEPGVKDLTDGG